MSKMFLTELKYAADCLINWLNKKNKIKNLELDIHQKIKYEKENPVHWKNGKCCICNFPLEINPKSISVLAEEMSYLDFHIRKEHKFLRKFLSDDQLNKSEILKSLTTYYQAFETVLQIIIILEDLINDSAKFDEITNGALRKFLKEKCAEFSDFDEVLNEIRKKEIKISNKKIPKMTLDFPLSDISIQTFTSKKILENIFHLIYVKIHLHHCHVPARILGYSHSFCNWKVRGNQIGFSCPAHNVFGFEFYFF